MTRFALKKIFKCLTHNKYHHPSEAHVGKYLKIRKINIKLTEADFLDVIAIYHPPNIQKGSENMTYELFKHLH